MIKMIVMDLDGTLLNDEKNISDYNLSILEKCRNKGIKIVIATARSEKSAERCIKLLKPDFMVLNGGALVINCNGKIIYQKFISIKTSDEIINECIKYGNIGYITIETENGYYVNYKETAWHTDYMHGIYYDFIKPLSQKAYKITVEIHNNKIAKEIDEKHSEINMVKFSDINSFGIYHCEARKILAIKAIVKKENIGIEKIIAFGDDFNDIEMLKERGIGIAMKNGVDEIKEIAKYICKSNNENGVGKWIEENIL
jgi:Cof subfamily protein (haloacid dehalogenase superfamily)